MNARTTNTDSNHLPARAIVIGRYAAFAELHELSPRLIGTASNRRPDLMLALRSGKNISLRTIERLERWMISYSELQAEIEAAGGTRGYGLDALFDAA